MLLAAGEKFGPYEIVEAIGAGGMGEVYRARDTKLKRQVALKVLPEKFARDPERMARFQREAEVLASLNHPNIATIHGVEERALVMEFVEGVSPKGPLPFDEAWKIASQIATALEYAHERGIVHRDLKPANIIITPEGVVKLLDFGLAKAFSNPNEPSASPENSPTLTLGATEIGVILGTAAYMAPEQARGKTVDKRADIWSFGVVLYELLTGERLFSGENAAETLAAVIHKPPDLARVPRQARRLLEECLQKDPRQRLRDIGDAKRIAGENPTVVAAPPTSRPGSLPWFAAAIMTAVAALALWAPWSSQNPADRPLMRLSVDLGPEAVRGRRVSAFLSPDGNRIVYTGRASGGLTQLYTRKLDQPGATLLAGTEILDPSPFFSPDGQWIGFADTDGKVKKIAAQGGTAVTMGLLPGNALSVIGASWGEDDNIIIGTGTGLWRMPAAGGPAQPLTKKGSPESFPQVLPGAKAVLFNRAGNEISTDLEGLEIAVLPFDTGQTKLLIQGGYWPRYLATSSKTGHLVYMHEGTLFGVGFDPQGLKLLGTPMPLLDDVAASAGITDGGGQFTFSNTGTFVYLSGRAGGYPVSWLESSGKITPLLAQPGTYGAPRFSPDGKRLAYIVLGSKGYEVYVYDLERSQSTQLTFLGSVKSELAWARDSKHLVYGDGRALWWMRADGAGQRQLLLDKSSNPRPAGFAPDGRLVFSPLGGTAPDIWTLPLDLADPEHPKPGKVEPFLADPALVEVDPAFSPDGKFIAYTFWESGNGQIFVRPFPGPGGVWKVSTTGGQFAAWSAATHELLFLGSDDRIMAATYRAQGNSFNVGSPRVWSPTPILRSGVLQNFDVSPDGKRVVMFPRPVAQNTGGSLHATFLLNFFDEVRRRLPTVK
jgi:Tol biopolymer transport system component/tRNA A-37 threonylcarbamoyl transferase component Bud32